MSYIPPDEPDESVYGPADQLIGLIATLALIAAVAAVVGAVLW